MEEDEEEEEEAHTLPFGDCHCRESYGRGMSGWGGQTSHNLPSSRLLRLPPRARGSSLSLFFVVHFFFSRMSINTESKRRNLPLPTSQLLVFACNRWRARGKELSDKCERERESNKEIRRPGACAKER